MPKKVDIRKQIQARLDEVDWTAKDLGELMQRRGRFVAHRSVSQYLRGDRGIGHDTLESILKELNLTIVPREDVQHRQTLKDRGYV